MFWSLGCEESREDVKSPEPSIARSNAVVPIGLQELEELQDALGGEILDAQLIYAGFLGVSYRPSPMVVLTAEKPMRQRVSLIRQLDLLAKAGEQPAPRLPAETLSQLGQLLQKLLLDVIDAERAAREDADE